MRTTTILLRTGVAAVTTAAVGLLGPTAHALEEDLERFRQPDRIALMAEADRQPIVPTVRVVSGGDEPTVHVVEAGETLADVADAHDVGEGWRRVFDANPDLEDPDHVRPGDELVVPEPEEELERRPLPAAPAPEPASDPAPAAPAEDGGGSAADEPEPAPSPATGGGVWDRLAQCEAGGNWSANTGNGFYGGLQFHPQTWSAHGGEQYAASAHQASRGQQIAIAERVLASQGWGAWPSCASQLGLR